MNKEIKDIMELKDVIFLLKVGKEEVDIVDLETAKTIKRLGYNEPSHWYYQDIDLTFCERGLKRVKYGKNRMNHNRYEDFYSAPNKDEFTKWFNKQLKI